MAAPSRRALMRRPFISGCRIGTELNKHSLSRSVLCTAIADIKSKIKRAKCHYFKNVLPSFIKNSPSKFRDYLNRKQLDAKPSTGPNRITVESLNTYFRRVLTIDDGNLPHVISCDENQHEPVTVSEAVELNLLQNLDVRKALALTRHQTSFLKGMPSG